MVFILVQLSVEQPVGLSVDVSAVRRLVHCCVRRTASAKLSLGQIFIHTNGQWACSGGHVVLTLPIC